ncbi:phospholipid transfer protein-like isoform X1 [Thunnus thynnus]|uniref:phospholipid transfer protein-like isoform X1 n=1 Tax=Thunnus thynnus TaxID=8237 RepID=UPI003526E4DD
MTSRVLSAFFFITLVSSITSDPTGLKLRFTSRTLDVLKDLGLEYMQTLVNHRFADFNFQGRIFKATIKGFKFTYLSVNPAQTAVSFQPNSGLQFEIRNMGFSGEFVRSFYMHFLWRDRRLSTKSVTFSGRGVNIKIGVNLKRNPQGHLNVQISTCEVKADHIITRHHSILGRLWDLLKPLYRWLFNRKFCPAVQEYAVPKINAMLESITMTKKLHESYNLDYHLSSNITVTPSCLNVPFRGVFFRQGETVDLSSIKSCMDPVFSESYRMAYVGFSEFFFNSIAMSLQKTGPFKLTIPKLSYLKERALAAVGLSTGRIKVKLAQSPTVRISRNGVSATVNARVQSLARPANKNPTVPVDCQVDIKVDIKGNRLILRSTKPVKCKLKPKTFTGRFMALFVNIGINKYITGTLKRLIEGLLIPLPEGVHYTEGKIDYHDGFVVIGGSLNFTPAGRRTVLKRIGRV